MGRLVRAAVPMLAGLAWKNRDRLIAAWGEHRSDTDDPATAPRPPETTIRADAA